MHAPEFPVNFRWLNTEQSLSVKQLLGHVVLLDFWTYGCINCIHAMSDIKWLEERYRNWPFMVIGVHSAKFHNERDVRNIENAVRRYDIQHPVLVDENFAVWNSYAVKACPTFVLLGADGQIIGYASGEGNLEALDASINQALAKAKSQGVLASGRLKSVAPPVQESMLRFPGKLTIDHQTRRMFIADSGHNRILEVDLYKKDGGKIISVIGSGKAGSLDGSYQQARFCNPQGLCVHAGILYIADTGNHLIRQVDLKEKRVTTLAGNGEKGYEQPQGEPALGTTLNSPWDVAACENRLYVAMAGNHQLWTVDLASGVASAWVGNGAEALVDGALPEAALAQPSGILCQDGMVYFIDSESSSLREVNINTGQVATLVGKGLFEFGHRDAAFEQAQLQHCLGLAKQDHLIYIADTYNHAIRVADLVKREMSTLVYSPGGGLCMVGINKIDSVPLGEPSDVAYMHKRLYIADTNNHQIRVFDLRDYALYDFILE